MPAKKKERLSPRQWTALKSRVLRAGDGSDFSFEDEEREYVEDRGLETVRLHARDFVRKRLAPANPRNEGRQTPVKGHPVFLAQHATGTCCRKCLEELHDIKAGREMSQAQINYVVDVIMRRVEEQV